MFGRDTDTALWMRDCVDVVMRSFHALYLGYRVTEPNIHPSDCFQFNINSCASSIKNAQGTGLGSLNRYICPLTVQEHPNVWRTTNLQLLRLCLHVTFIFAKHAFVKLQGNNSWRNKPSNNTIPDYPGRETKFESLRHRIFCKNKTWMEGISS